MTDQDIQIAIGEFCGWKWYGDEKWDRSLPYWRHTTEGSSYCELPNYIYDLNAMHEAEKLLSEENYYIKFLSALGKIVCKPSDSLMRHCCNYQRASAKQRAEAFVIAIGQ